MALESRMGSSCFSTGGRWMLVLASGVIAGAAPAQDTNLDLVGFDVPGLQINGAVIGDRAGQSVAAAGDVNGDGFGDLIVGAPYSDVGGVSTGSAFVVFGTSQTGFINTLALSSVSTTQGFRIDGVAAGDSAGFGVAGAGDVNGDGLADVVVSAHYADVGANSNAGVVYVVFGKTSTTRVFLSDMTGTSLGFRIEGVAANDVTGFRIAGPGDVNDDGLADLLIAAPGADPGGVSAAGTVYVVLGRSSFATVALSALGAQGFAIEGVDSSDQLGTGVAGAGDLNGDGMADIVLGAGGGDPAGATNAGETYVVFGRTATTTIDLTSFTGASAGGLGFRIDGESNSDSSGLAVGGGGDINGDNVPDLIIGAPLDDNGASATNCGRTWVVFGKSTDTPVLLSALGAGGFGIMGIDSNDESGRSVSGAGDVNGDGLADILVNAAFADPNGLSSAGEAYLIFGKTDTDPVFVSDLGGLGFRLEGGSANDNAGLSVAGAGDVNGDGLADLAAGIPDGDPFGLASAGAVGVMFSPFGAGPLPTPETSTYRAVVPGGNSRPQAIASLGWGDDLTSHSDARAWVDFASGTAGTVVATVTRHAEGLSRVPTSNVAPMQWRLSTTKLNWSSGSTVTLRYSPQDIVGLNPANLFLYSAPSTAGPFVIEGGGVVHDTARRTFRAPMKSWPRVYIVAEDDTTAPTVEFLLLNGNPTSSDVLDFLVNFSEPVAPTFTRTDITVGGTLAGSSVIEFIDTDPTYVVRVAARPLATDGKIDLSITGDVADKAAQPMVTPVTSGTVDVYRPGLILGDVNLSRTVDVSDVTALANSIVNGTPLP